MTIRVTISRDAEPKDQQLFVQLENACIDMDTGKGVWARSRSKPELIRTGGSLTFHVWPQQRLVVYEE